MPQDRPGFHDGGDEAPADSAAPTPDEAAVAWFVRLHDETSTPADRAAFAAWLAADRAHAKAWGELDLIWNRLDGSAEQATRGVPPGQVRERPRQRRVWRPLALAAGLFVALALAWQLLPPGLLADHRTAIGERRLVALADGSRVELGPASAVDIDDAPGRRGVTLIAGQAFFVVARDPARPFVVSAGAGRIEVLGTAFDVKRDGEGAAVAVTENVVAVSAGASGPVRVEAGFGVRYGSSSVSAVEAVDLDAVQAWRQGRLIFQDAPLSAVLAELGRHRRGHVQLLGRDLGSLRVTAAFDAADSDAALDAIAASLGLRVLRATRWLIALLPA